MITLTKILILELTPSEKRRLESAAVAAEQSLSEFVLQSALARAAETMPRRSYLRLNAERWTAGQAALDVPMRPNRRVKKFSGKPSVLERRRK